MHSCHLLPHWLQIHLTTSACVSKLSPLNQAFSLVLYMCTGSFVDVGQYALGLQLHSVLHHLQPLVPELLVGSGATQRSDLAAEPSDPALLLQCSFSSSAHTAVRVLLAGILACQLYILLAKSLETCKFAVSSSLLHQL